MTVVPVMVEVVIFIILLFGLEQIMILEIIVIIGYRVGNMNSRIGVILLFMIILICWPMSVQGRMIMIS